MAADRATISKRSRKLMKRQGCPRAALWEMNGGHELNGLGHDAAKYEHQPFLQGERAV
jgi:hypothetical protein